MGRLRRSLLVLILLGLPGLASSEALGQTIGDLTTVTTVAGVTTVANVTTPTPTPTATTAVAPTLTQSVSNATDEGTALVQSGGGISGTPSVTSGGGSSGGGSSGGTTSKDGGSLSGATAPITSTASSLTGKSGIGSTADAPKQETGAPKSEGPSIQTISCGEASQDPRTFGAFLLTLKEGERAAGGGNGGNGGKGGSGVLSAGGEAQQQPTPSLPAPAPMPEEPGFPTWLGLVALAGFALGIGAILAIVAQSLLAERRLGRPVADGAVRRSV